MYCSLLIHSPIEGHLGCFQVLKIIIKLLKTFIFFRFLCGFKFSKEVSIQQLTSSLLPKQSLNSVNHPLKPSKSLPTNSVHLPKQPQVIQYNFHCLSANHSFQNSSMNLTQLNGLLCARHCTRIQKMNETVLLAVSEGNKALHLEQKAQECFAVRPSLLQQLPLPAVAVFTPSRSQPGAPQGYDLAVYFYLSLSTSPTMHLRWLNSQLSGIC